jgi:hypothetical protein
MYKSNIDDDRETDRERDKAQEIVPYLFSLKGVSLEKARSQLAKFCLSAN